MRFNIFEVLSGLCCSGRSHILINRKLTLSNFLLCLVQKLKKLTISLIDRRLHLITSGRGVRPPLK